jgi:hypothetical protein
MDPYAIDPAERGDGRPYPQPGRTRMLLPPVAAWIGKVSTTRRQRWPPDSMPTACI